LSPDAITGLLHAAVEERLYFQRFARHLGIDVGVCIAQDRTGRPDGNFSDRASFVISASAMPTPKYSSVSSPVSGLNGNTAIEFICALDETLQRPDTPGNPISDSCQTTATMRVVATIVLGRRQLLRASARLSVLTEFLME